MQLHTSVNVYDKFNISNSQKILRQAYGTFWEVDESSEIIKTSLILENNNSKDLSL